ncbi:hypothetical protein COS64_04350 [archaeon CG06_land_8_20_14_3_00_37_11]|nr:MAG: hypothetical protein COS64_04350 [archaeon CG06_land_8_20_14_3_00_37_11]
MSIESLVKYDNDIIALENKAISSSEKLVENNCKLLKLYLKKSLILEEALNNGSKNDKKVFDDYLDNKLKIIMQYMKITGLN